VIGELLDRLDAEPGDDGGWFLLALELQNGKGKVGASDIARIQSLDPPGGYGRWCKEECLACLGLAPTPPAADHQGPKPPEPSADAERERHTAEQDRRAFVEERRREAVEKRRALEAAEQRRTEARRVLREERRRKAVEERRAREEEERRRAAEIQVRKEQLRRQILAILRDDFLAADEEFDKHRDSGLVSEEEYQTLRTAFVRDWVRAELDLELDLEQAAAVADTAGHVQVVARAGSGKTRTLTTRAIFLQKHCGVSPSEQLLLAFNRRAADEMRVRLQAALGSDVPHVMTFHALAHALVHPKEQLVSDDIDADHFGYTADVQAVISEHLSAPGADAAVRNLLLEYFRSDWEYVADGTLQMTMPELREYLDSLPRVTLKGDHVKSFGEKTIANTLFENGVEYRYEKAFPWDQGIYRPDFTVPVGNDRELIIEYFGLLDDPVYRQQADRKRAYWDVKGPRWKLIEFQPRDITQGGVATFQRMLLSRLTDEGVVIRPRTDEEIWELTRERAIRGFSRTVGAFVGRCRKKNLSPQQLETLIAGHASCSDQERAFLEIGARIYRGYLAKAQSQGKEDFDGLVWRAADAMSGGTSQFVRDAGQERGDVAQLRFVMIDEFQDFSEMFWQLALGIRTQSPEARFFCVGDDWQAINGFAGSDLTYFRDFSVYFPSAHTRHVGTNYRSTPVVVEAGNVLMDGLGSPAVAHEPRGGEVTVADLECFEPTEIEAKVCPREEFTPAVLRLIRRSLKRGKRVTLLSRTNMLSWDIKYRDHELAAGNSLRRLAKHLHSFLEPDVRGRVAVSTVHKYKGLEQDDVILIDAVSQKYPLIHPYWVFTRVFGDTVKAIDAEERRLFYVALTRGKQNVCVLTSGSVPSPYLASLGLPTLGWHSLPAMPTLGKGRLEVRVFSAWAAREHLTRLGFEFDFALKCRWILVPQDSFDLGDFCSHEWFGPGVRVEVYSETGELLETRIRQADGHWRVV